MYNIWQALAGNLAMVGLVVSIWAHAIAIFNGVQSRYGNLVLGAFIGIATISSMVLAIRLSSGVLIDLRAGLLATAGLFGGPAGAAIAFALGAACRFILAGTGAVEGIVNMAIISVIGVVFHAASRRSGVSMITVATLAGVVAMALLAFMMFTPNLVKAGALETVGVPLMVLNGAAVMFSGLVVLVVKKREFERELLRAALAQAPDYLFIKDCDSRFVLANQNTAAFGKFSSPDELVGLTDFAIMPGPRAAETFAAEQEIMRTGQPMLDVQENILDRIFLTSKAPIRDGSGRIIGLAGVTRDITERERLEREFREYKDLFSLAFDGMSDGFAIFDKGGYLITCNNRYRDFFPLTAHRRVPGANTIDLMRAGLAMGEFLNFPDVDDEAILRAFRTDAEREFHLCNGHWISVKVRWTEDKAIVVASDITELKQSEEELRQSAMKLRDLAEKDPLTGVPNRRVFDDAFGKAIRHAGRNHSTLSLLMIDVDRFKAYNDTYGHQAGDACLVAVADCLKQAAARSNDLVARLGGEEFAILLPDTDETGAFAVAKDFIALLKEREIPHSGSEFGHVTASVGIADASGLAMAPNAAGLIRKADAALYLAKNSGRNRARAWSELNEDPRLDGARRA